MESKLGPLVRAIREAGSDTERLDEDEQLPPPHVVEQLTSLIQEAELYIEGVIDGDVEVFYGEMSVTWRSDDALVRVSCFPTHPAQLIVGPRRAPLGSYRSLVNPAGADIADALSAILAAPVA